MQNFTHKGIWLAAIAILVPLSPIYAECAVLNVYAPAKFRPGQPVRLQPFKLPPVANTIKESPEEIRTVFMDALADGLAKSKFFGTVERATTPAERAEGLTMSGSITGMDRGRSAGETIGFGLGSKELRVFTTLSDSAGPIADGECMIHNSSTTGMSTGLLGAAASRVVSQARGTSGMLGTARLAGFGLSRAFASDSKQAAKAQKEKRKIPSELHGETKLSATAWRDKPLAEWEKDEVQDAISNWVVTTNSEGFTRVDSLWVTQRSYEASVYFLGRQGQDTGGDLHGRDWRQGFLLDIQPLERFRGKDVLVLALTYSRRTIGGNSYKRASPFLWNSAEVAKGTYLTTAGGQRLDPVEVLDRHLSSYLIERREKLIGKLSWRSHPVIFVFPAKTSEGKPFLSASDQTLELRSIVEGQAVRIVYDLRNSGVTKVDELAIGGEAVATSNR